MNHNLIVVDLGQLSLEDGDTFALTPTQLRKVAAMTDFEEAAQAVRDTGVHAPNADIVDLTLGASMSTFALDVADLLDDYRARA